MDSGISLYKELKEKIGEKEAEHLVEYIKSTTRDREIFARFDVVDEKFDKIDDRFDRVDEKFNKIDERFDIIDERFKGVDERFAKIDLRFNELHNEILSVRTELKEDIANLRAEFKQDITLIYKAISDNNKWLIGLIFTLWLIGTLSIIITIFLK
ncbi:MAG: hypothetical protein M0016_07720 [Deltaproteobacteria bacterium]|nr:hypothetical protein [Deltaproteobacteria bacterium]MCL5879611.1 hypothetical protein [Deltaproteobacteria bacterium]MDA8305034.1 hypothetical protein [Deltaproteobacteria bacterium]